MTQPAQSMAGEAAHPTSDAAQQLVINLTSSTTPMSLVRPAFKELERFTFFVSRRREDGRERFRLHMGYFATRADAEQWLAVVRTVYPGAWISDAPGKKLRSESSTGNDKKASGATGVHCAIEEPKSAAPVAAAPAANPPVLAPARTATPSKPAVSPPVVQPPAPRPAAKASQPSANDLSDSQVLRVLETTPGAGSTSSVDVSDVPMVGKLDALSLQALRSDLSKNLPVPFAVQLDWSAAPIDLQRIPPLAIFRAYTLYTVGCLVEGRRWYGLRLGFFTDAISAKQVAQYVRSEFKSVSVVPVSTRERTQADATGGIDVDRISPARKGAADASEEITLLPDGERGKADPKSKGAVTEPTASKPPAAGKPAARKDAAKADAAAKTGQNGARVLQRGAGRSGRNRTLEETLEILGASQLTIENARGERLNITGRQKRSDSEKTSTFTKLLDRLADRLRT